MTRKTYIARFSNGVEIKRQTQTRTYTHAYLKIVEYIGREQRPQISSRQGFSSSEQQAHRNMGAEMAWTKRHTHTVILAEVVPVELLQPRQAADPEDDYAQRAEMKARR